MWDGCTDSDVSTGRQRDERKRRLVMQIPIGIFDPAYRSQPGRLTAPAVHFRNIAANQRGRVDCPIKNSSTDLAHWRPSRIAQTTSDCPRRMSPAVNTFGTDVA